MPGRVNHFVMSHGIIRKQSLKRKEIWYGTKLKYQESFPKPLIYRDSTEKYKSDYLPVVLFC